MEFILLMTIVLFMVWGFSCTKDIKKRVDRLEIKNAIKEYEKKHGHIPNTGGKIKIVKINNKCLDS